MTISPVLKEKLACAWFFVTPSLAYGILSARLPALKIITDADDAETGTVLLALGCSTLVGLLVCGFLIEKFGARILAISGAVFLACAMSLASLASSWPMLALGCGCAGLGVGLCDVAMNALGIEIEKERKILVLAFLHGASSAGGVAGSLTGSLFAACNISPFLNFAIILGLWLCLAPIIIRYVPGSEYKTQSGKSFLAAFPLIVLLCGILSLLCHVVEGSAAEWGSILLNTVKHASQQEAALTFACFTGGMVLCRFSADRLRQHINDIWLLFAGSLLGATGMILAILSPIPSLCLAAYALMGVGLAPVVPILFSRAGAVPGIGSGRASAVVSIFSYSGMLLFPPLLGYIAEESGLSHALWILVFCCLAVGLGSLALKKGGIKKPGKKLDGSTSNS